jgi:hypothetical protein
MIFDIAIAGAIELTAAALFANNKPKASLFPK